MGLKIHSKDENKIANEYEKWEKYTQFQENLIWKSTVKWHRDGILWQSYIDSISDNNLKMKFTCGLDQKNIAH